MYVCPSSVNDTEFLWMAQHITKIPSLMRMAAELSWVQAYSAALCYYWNIWQNLKVLWVLLLDCVCFLFFGFIPKVLCCFVFFSLCLCALLQDGWMPNWIRTAMDLHNNTALTCQCTQIVSVCILLYNDQHSLCIVLKI